MLIKVKDNEGTVYTNDMSEENEFSILEIHFCTSYTQVIVQTKTYDEERDTYTYPEKDIIILLDGANCIDMIAVKEDEIGEWA